MPGLTTTSEIPESTIDLLVIGLGPAGVACALQARRDGLSVAAAGDEPVGGLVRAARRLDNLPAEPGISGEELAQRMDRQVAESGVPVVFVHVSALERDDGGYRATLADGRTIASRAVCLATGTRPRDWEMSTGGQHVHRDARSLPERMHGARAVVVGGGEAALDTALTCRDRGAMVTVLVRSEAPRAVPGLVEETHGAGIEVRAGSRVSKVRGAPGDWKLETGEGELGAAHLVVCIGREPRAELPAQATGDGFDPSVTQSRHPGLFLAGDLIRGRDRYVATAMGDGQRAAVQAAAYLKEAGR
jgi:thioredoxin reductase (NADPH)